MCRWVGDISFALLVKMEFKFFFSSFLAMTGGYLWREGGWRGIIVKKGWVGR